MKPILTLGQLLLKLEKLPSDLPVCYDFCRFWPNKPFAFRWNQEVCLGVTTTGTSDPKPQVTVGDLLQWLHEVNGGYLQGYKGGDYSIDHDTRVWVSDRQQNCFGTAVVGVKHNRLGRQVVLVTRLHPLP